MSKLNLESAPSGSDAIRRHAYEKYVVQAQRRKEKLISINVGDVHREMGLSNRVPLVCAALASKKFLSAHGLRIVSKTGPPSGQSTTVTYLYEIDAEHSGSKPAGSLGASTTQSRQEAWQRLRGALKDVYAEYGGGEAYLRAVRATFRDADEQK